MVLLSVLTACTPQSDLSVSKPAKTQSVPGSEWKNVVSKRGRFSVLMPGVPQAATNVLPTVVGNCVAYSVTVEVAQTIAYAVWVYEWPPKTEFSDWPRTLDSIQTNMLTGGKLISEKPIEIGAHQGKELVFEKYSGQARVTARIYRVNETICAAFVVMPNQFFTSPKNPDTPRKASTLMNCFFDSLKFH